MVKLCSPTSRFIKIVTALKVGIIINKHSFALVRKSNAMFCVKHFKAPVKVAAKIIILNSDMAKRLKNRLSSIQINYLAEITYFFAFFILTAI